MKVPLLIYLFTQLDYIITMPESARPHLRLCLMTLQAVLNDRILTDKVNVWYLLWTGTPPKHEWKWSQSKNIKRINTARLVWCTDSQTHDYESILLINDSTNDSRTHLSESVSQILLKNSSLNELVESFGLATESTFDSLNCKFLVSESETDIRLLHHVENKINIFTCIGYWISQ